VIAGKCIAPACESSRVHGGLFCPVHVAAPATQRGGWLSAERRRRVRAAVPASSSLVAGSDLDCSNVARRLWVGAKPPFDRHLPDFDTLVLCAQELQPAVVAFRGRILRCPLPDGELTQRQLRLVLESGRNVAGELHGGKTVLVTCAQGVNRSALVAGLGLGLVTYLSADQIVAILRARRAANCLYNAHFRSILTRYIGEGRRPKTVKPG
jgi:hypothetical protein